MPGLKRFVTAPETESWGERYFQYRDPNGLTVQLVQVSV